MPAPQNIAEFVRAGGTAVVTYFSGIVDENDHIRLGGYPGAFAELLGIRIEEFFPLRDGESVQLNAFGSGTLFSELGRSVGARCWRSTRPGRSRGRRR